ncbi:MAG: NHL repeat-containing protein, partial [Solirubrobacterales bacterium]
QAPIDVAVAPGGGVYVADSGNDRVQRFSADGVPEGILGGLSQPQGVAVDRLGRLFVTDTGNNRIRFFDNLGAPLGGWGMPGSAPGEFDAPQGIAADCLGRIYVADAFNNRIQVFADPGAPAGGPCVPDLTQLISWVRELPLRPGLRLSVVVRLVAAKRALEHDRLRPACALLRSVAWSLERFSSRGPVDGLDQLIAGVGALRGNIGCRSARSR